MLRHDVGDILEHFKALDVEVRAFLIACQPGSGLLHRGLKRGKILVDIPAELDTVKAGHSGTRLERNLDAVHSNCLFNSHAVPPYSVALPDLVDVERVPVLLLVAAVGIYTALYQLS